MKRRTSLKDTEQSYISEQQREIDANFHAAIQVYINQGVPEHKAKEFALDEFRYVKLILPNYGAFYLRNLKAIFLWYPVSICWDFLVNFVIISLFENRFRYYDGLDTYDFAPYLSFDTYFSYIHILLLLSYSYFFIYSAVFLHVFVMRHLYPVKYPTFFESLCPPFSFYVPTFIHITITACATFYTLFGLSSSELMLKFNYLYTLDLDYYLLNDFKTYILFKHVDFYIPLFILSLIFSFIINFAFSRDPITRIFTDFSLWLSHIYALRNLPRTF